MSFKIMLNPRSSIITQRHQRVLTAKNSKQRDKLVPKSNHLREFSAVTSLHGIMYLGESERPLIEK